MGVMSLKAAKKAMKRKQPIEEAVESEGEMSDASEVDEKKDYLFTKPDDMDDEGNDSDRELQIAFRDGLLKDGLNYLVPKKRHIINKAAEMRELLGSYRQNLQWIETLDVSTRCEEMTIETMNDDFERELRFYKQAEKAVQMAVPKLQRMGVPVFRPEDYYAEMAKSDGHMQKVRKRLLDLQEGKERQEALRRMREEKKYASKVQKEVLENRQKDKKALTEAVKKHRKGMKGQLEDMLNNARSLQMDDEEDDKRTMSRGGSFKEERRAGMNGKAGRSVKRDKRNEKFGWGGQKKRGKKNTKESFEDVFRGSGKSGMGGGRKGRLGGNKRR